MSSRSGADPGAGPAAPRPRSTTRRATLLGLLYVGAAFLLYAPTLRVPFLLDDLTGIALMFPTGELDFGSLPHLLWPDLPPYAFHAHFRPLGWASLFLDAMLFGPDPVGFRATALVLHGSCALLVMACARRILGPRSWIAPVLAGMVFLIWPGAVEPVVWVSHRFTLLVTLFLLAGVYLSLRYAARGRGLPLIGIVAGAALLSKDSAIAECWVLPLATLLAAPAALRWKRSLQVALVTGACVAGDMLLRRLCTGRFVPAFQEGGSVLETFDLVAVLEALPRTLRLLATPVVADGGLARALLAGILTGVLVLLWSALRPSGFPSTLLILGVLLVYLVPNVLLVPCILVGWGWVFGATLRSGPDPTRPGRIPLLLLGAVLVLGLPTLFVDADLAGSRRLYLPAALLAAGLGTGIRDRAAPAVLLVLLASVPVLLINERPYREAGRRIEEVVEDIERGAVPGGRVVLAGLPSTWSGAPLFGPRAEHLQIRFRPPLGRGDYEIVTVRPEQVAAFVEDPNGTTRLMAYEEVEVAGDRDLFPTLSVLLLPGDGVAEDAAVDLLRPDGATWPDPAAQDGRGTWVIWSEDGTPEVEGVYQLTIEVGGRRVAWIFRPQDQPGLTVLETRPDGSRVVGFPADTIRPVFPVPGQARIQALAAGPGIEARAWLRRLGSELPRRVVTGVARSFVLGGGG